MTMCKTITLLLMSAFALYPVGVRGQSTFSDYQKKKAKQQEEYLQRKAAEHQGYIDVKRKDFEEYRRKKNAVFAKYLQQQWVIMPKEDGLPAPKMPDPVTPISVPKDETNPLPMNPVEIPKGDIKPVEIPIKETPLEIPLPDSQHQPTFEYMQVNLFGMSLDVAMTDKQKFVLKNLTESEIGKIWDKLSDEEYTPMFDNCAQYIQEMRLNGWATLNLCKAIGERLEGKGTNEAVLLQTYLMTQLGYDARLVRINNDRLSMICPANVKLCEVSFLKMNGKQYYIWGESKGQIYTYKNNFDAATRSIDFTGGTLMRLNEEQTVPRVYTSTWNTRASVNVSVSKCLMNYYRDMPLIGDWSFYARQPLDRNVSQQIMPILSSVIDGKNSLDAANELLHFVQTAFKYETDERQFGREKTDFKEELFYYPACDCEDRAVLFSDLIYTLLGLDVVLLYYPNHLCVAVKFNEDINGDFVSVDGKKYIICDPTYINASVGNCMPKYKTTKPTIYKIYTNQ